MANSPVDKSKQFVDSGMTLITDPAADYWLEKAAKAKKPVDPRNDEDYDTWEYGMEYLPGDMEWADGFVGK